jgi:hypothetical protein
MHKTRNLREIEKVSQRSNEPCYTLGISYSSGKFQVLSVTIFSRPIGFGLVFVYCTVLLALGRVNRVYTMQI